MMKIQIAVHEGETHGDVGPFSQLVVTNGWNDVTFLLAQFERGRELPTPTPPFVASVRFVHSDQIVTLIRPSITVTEEKADYPLKGQFTRFTLHNPVAVNSTTPEWAQRN